MNRKLTNDLRAWELGSLSVDDLLARHPGEAEQVRRLTGLFTEIRSLAEGPIPDPTRGWNQVRSRMAEHLDRKPASLLDRMGQRLPRKVAFGIAAALLAVPAVALAASNNTVQDVTDFVLNGVDDLSISLFGGNSTTGGSAGDGSGLSLDVGDGLSSDPSVTSTRTPAKQTATQNTESSPVAPSGNDGKNVTATPPASSKVSGSAASGLAGSDGGNGVAGADGSGKDGESKDGQDAKSADASPSPTPTPSQGANGTASSASTPNVP